MKEQQQEKTNSTVKKEWQKPALEIISKDQIRSGVLSSLAEGVSTFYGNLGSAGS